MVCSRTTTPGRVPGRKRMSILLPSVRMVRRAVVAWALLSSLSPGQSFYREAHGLFSTRPDEKKSLQNIGRFGPVGLSIDLLQPAFTMRIHAVEAGSPAEQARLRPGQFIESINGQQLADIDPRIQLGRILAEAEAGDGVITFKVADRQGGKAQQVEVKIPVLGAYSETWPLNCPKSDKIVRGVADYLTKPDSTKGLADIGMLFLLSTGDRRDLEVVRQWARKAPAHKYPWYVGYGGIGLAECYLRTGDPEILENVQRWVDSAARTQHNDAWAGRGSALTSYGSGHLNAAGTHVLTFLLLAKECGANVPDRTLHGALRHFFRYAGRGGNPYGDGRPEVGFVDNGKNGKLAFAMAAAAALTPEGEDSVYAQARDTCAMQSFYTTSFMLHGHTGGGIGEIWRSAAMGLLYDRKPRQYRDFMDSRKWHYDLSRRYDGSFGIVGGSGYDKELWGVAYPLTYTIPRKTLRITGAPRTRFSKPYKLPARPWGAEADNAFVSLEAVADASGKKQDLSGETLARDSSMPFLRRFHGSKQPSDDEIRRYMTHQDHNIRFVAANKVVGVNSGYIGWTQPGGKIRRELILEFLGSQDARVRRAMFSAVARRPEVITPAIFELAVKALKAPGESWWVKDSALQIIGRGSLEQILPLVDLLLPYLRHEEAWLRNGALTALTPVAGDERCYRKILPAMGELVRTNQRVSVTLGFAPAIRAKIRSAGPEIQKLAASTLKETFTGYAGKKASPQGQDLKPTFDFHLEGIAASLADVPGGLDVLYEVARQRFPNEILPYKKLFLESDPGRFGPRLKEAIKPIIQQELIPEFVGRNRVNLRKLAASELQSERPGGTRDVIDGLAALYARAGEEEYSWNMFADLRNAEWSYLSFDPLPAEQVPFDQLITRYREVTMPGGMENWYAMGFDPGKSGWLAGASPFGNYNGKLPARPITKCHAGCVGPVCFGATRVNTLWEKEVLLMRGTFKLPAVRDGHRYRLMVNDGNHVGSGGGHIIYLNGRKLIEARQGNGRGAGGSPKGAYITREFLEELKGGQVTIALMTFIRYNDKYKVKPTSEIPQGKISLHLEEQKIPPMGDDLVRKSAKVIAMLSSQWQASLDPEDASQNPDDFLFRWDGRFSENSKVTGGWKLVTEVAEVSEFDPAAKRHAQARNPVVSSIVFRKGGATAEPTRVWSGDTLMDLEKLQALKMRVKPIGGSDYLFLEAGGFSKRHKPDWKSKWLVLKRE